MYVDSDREPGNRTWPYSNAMFVHGKAIPYCWPCVQTLRALEALAR